MQDQCDNCKILEAQLEYYKANRKNYKRRLELIKRHAEYIPEKLYDTKIEIRLTNTHWKRFTLGYWVKRLNALIDGDTRTTIQEKKNDKIR